MSEQQHVPVLLDEIIEIFQPTTTDTLLDGTLGLGGHTKAFLQASVPSGRVVGIDADPRAISMARENLAEFGDRVTYINGNFANLKQLFKKIERPKELKNSLPGGGIVEKGIPSEFSHILLDLGFNSYQIDDIDSGLTFSSETSMSMLYGISETLPQSCVEAINMLTGKLGRYPDVPDLIRHLRAEQLEEIIRLYGEERHAKSIAVAIKEGNPETSQELYSIISQTVSSGYERGRINPATRTFQAFRIAVNRELEVLASALPQAAELLASGGKLAVISFHSLEDRIVKNFIRSSKIVTAVNKKPIVASKEETKDNPRSRSAKLRVATKD